MKIQADNFINAMADSLSLSVSKTTLFEPVKENRGQMKCLGKHCLLKYIGHLINFG